jgi:DNA-binding LacI/PurR family transcriptional regulator
MFLEHYYLIRCVHRRVACFCAPQVVSDLRGETHSGFFSDALEKSGFAPQHVSVDGAEAWNGVKQQMEAIHGDPDAVTVQFINGEVRLARCPPCLFPGSALA